MNTIYLILEISALILVIVIPLKGPRNKKNNKKATIEISDWAINENGFLESRVKQDEPKHHHTIK